MTKTIPTLLIALLLALGVAADPAAATTFDARPVVGERERVAVVASGGELEEGMARVDTGAAYSSIDEELADAIGLDEQRPDDHIRVRSALGSERRPVYDLTLRLAGRTISSSVSLADRSELSNPILVGRNDLDGFLVAVGREQLTTPEGDDRAASPSALLGLLPPPPTDPGALLALLPLATALVVAVLVGIGVVADGLRVELATAFPVVVTGMVVERMWERWEQEGLGAAASTSAWTVLAAVVATLLLFAEPLRGLAADQPLLLGAVAAALAVAVGSYRGLRLTEMTRFQPAARGDR